MLLQELVDHAHEQHAQNDREHGAVIADSLHRDAEEVQTFGTVDAGVQQDRAQKCAQETIGFQAGSGCKADEDGQEVEGRLVDGVEDGVGARLRRDAEHVGQQGQHRTSQAACHQHRDHRAERAADEGEDRVADVAVILCQILGCGLIVLHAAAGLDAVDLDDLFIQVRDILADDHLIFAVLDDDVQHAGHLLDGIGVKLGSIPQYKAQTGHAMGRADNVVRSAGLLDDAGRHGLIIFLCHYFSISFPQS